jgi:YihY family inner membrane protein
MAMWQREPLERVLRSIDRVQQGSKVTAFAVGVVKKYGDDRGGQLAALVSFYAFLSFFPLTLVVVTATAFLAHRNPALAERLRASSLSQFPVVGTELTSGEKALHGSGLGLAVGIGGLLWGGLGVTQTLQYAFHEVWHVPHKDRPPFVVRIGRSIGVLALLGVGVVASAVLGALGSLITNSPAAGMLGLVGSFVMAFGLFLSLFWLMSPRNTRIIDLLPGVTVAAVGWVGLQTIGLRLVTHQLRRSSQLYGTIGAALGLIAFFLLATQVVLYGLEVTVVRVQRLWPRSLLQPPLTGPDRQMLITLAKQEERRPEERISVEIDSTTSQV